MTATNKRNDRETITDANNVIDETIEMLLDRARAAGSNKKVLKTYLDAAIALRQVREHK